MTFADDDTNLQRGLSFGSPTKRRLPTSVDRLPALRPTSWPQASVSNTNFSSSLVRRSCAASIHWEARSIRFASVIEPMRGREFHQSVQRLALTSPTLEAIALKVTLPTDARTPAIVNMDNPRWPARGTLASFSTSSSSLSQAELAFTPLCKRRPDVTTAASSHTTPAGASAQRPTAVRHGGVGYPQSLRQCPHPPRRCRLAPPSRVAGFRSPSRPTPSRASPACSRQNGPDVSDR